MVFNLVFAINNISSKFSFFFFIIDLYFLILAVIAQLFNPTVILAISIGRLTKEEKVLIIVLFY